MGDREIKNIIVLGFIILLLGCSTPHQPIEVEYKPSEILLPKAPDLPIKNLTDNSAPDEVMKSYVASIYIQKSYISEINKIISQTSRSIPSQSP